MLLIEEINFCEPVELVRSFADIPWTVFLDSASISENSHYSFIGIDPFLKIQSKNGYFTVNEVTYPVNPFAELQKILTQYSLDIDSNLCPFQGGAMGYFGYDLCQHLEKFSTTLLDTIKCPDMSIGLYDLVLGFNLASKKAWIFSSGYPEQKLSLRKKRATLRRDFLLQQINAALQKPKSQLPFKGIEGDIESNFNKTTYQAAIRKAIHYILDGDIFQVNLSQRFSAKMKKTASPFALYEKFRSINPAPFSAYLNFSPTYLISASPERLLKLQGKHVKTQPIKGTCPRGKTPSLDEAAAKKLLMSEKDRSENIMIVDLMRNDLSRVCEENSIHVPTLCDLESFSTVHHLVSTIIGKLRADKNAIDLLCAAFPGGSVTGAPKIRAMEIITEIEKYARGPYCGSIGYIGFNGDMDTSIVIRTFTVQHDNIVFQAGGAIVADSVPTAEYQETLDKAYALINSLL